MAKSYGDGMLLEFDTAAAAAACSLEIQHQLTPLNVGRDPDARMHLRMGITVGELVADDVDLYGHEVNLASRLAGLAKAGEIVVSAEVRHQLVDGLDADVEDLGECWLKHVDGPVRVARLGPSQASVHPAAPLPGALDTVGVAVLPFTPRVGSPAGTQALGDLLADDLIAQLSRMPQLSVISRLSTTAFRGREAALSSIASRLDVQYVISGKHASDGGRVRLSVQMVERHSESVIWAQTFEAQESALLGGDESLVDAVAAGIASAIVGTEVRRACSQPLPTLLSYTILLGAISLLHSLSLRDFERSRDMLEYLIERHPRMPVPRAWLALWHVMRVGQGWSDDPQKDAAIARRLAADALDLHPQHSLSLAVDGLVCAYVHKDMDSAGERYEAALRANPSESLAWLYQSAWHAYREEGSLAVRSALRAQRLSPLDPMRYYYDNFTSTAMLADGDLAGAIEYGRRSMRANRLHGPTLRILAIAHSLSGHMEQARAMVAHMRELEPEFTVSAFRRRYPGQRPAQVERYVQALAEAGLPR